MRINLPKNRRFVLVALAGSAIVLLVLIGWLYEHYWAANASGFWLSREGKRAGGARIISIDSPLIQSDGHVDLPAHSVAISGKSVSPQAASRWQFVEQGVTELLLGRDLKYGERAFIRGSGITFIEPTFVDEPDTSDEPSTTDNAKARRSRRKVK